MQNKRGGINIGTSLILVIFVLLSLVTFAALSYMSAKSDYTLSKEAANRTASYYDANRMAELYMANIEGLLSKHLNNSSTKEEYDNGIEALFSDNDNIVVTRDNGQYYLEYDVPITSGQNLLVKLRVNYPQTAEENIFYIEKWSTAVNDEWLQTVKNDSAKSGVKFLFD